MCGLTVSPSPVAIGPSRPNAATGCRRPSRPAIIGGATIMSATARVDEAQRIDGAVAVVVVGREVDVRVGGRDGIDHHLVRATTRPVVEVVGVRQSDAIVVAALPMTSPSSCSAPYEISS